MGYGLPGDYGFFPLSQLGEAEILWVIGVYGLWEVWVKRVSTVTLRARSLGPPKVSALLRNPTCTNIPPFPGHIPSSSDDTSPSK
ncbi:hypothetical protein FKP32DRAFT_1568714 [Trametes sanguinea]|nr:hypothetical protein FKP32DRAFT_1568714 [Trametes sanguinea]